MGFVKIVDNEGGVAQPEKTLDLLEAEDGGHPNRSASLVDSI